MASYKIDFRIGTDFLLPTPSPPPNGDFTALVHLGLPLPDRFSFVPYGVTKSRGDGRSIGDGNPIASWTWKVLSQIQLNALLAFFSSDADASVDVTIRTPIERGYRADTGDYEAIMHRPVQGEDKTQVVDSTAPVWEEITIKFTKLTPR